MCSLITCCFILVLQEAGKADSTQWHDYFMQAYEYVARDSTLYRVFQEDSLSSEETIRVAVSDSIVDLAAIFFLDKLILIRYGQVEDPARYKELEGKEAEKIYKKDRDPSWQRHYYYAPLRRLPRPSDPNFILFFSEPEEGIVFGELFYIERIGKIKFLNYNAINRNSIKELRWVLAYSREYLFQFEGGRLKHVYAHSAMYN